MAKNIWALVHTAKTKGKTVYGVSFPDFPGVASGGDSMEDVLERGRSTLAFHIAGMVEDGDPMPTLRTLDELQSDADVKDALSNEGAIIAQISVDLPGKPVRVNISIDDGLLASIDRAARMGGKTRSGFIAEATQAHLRTAGAEA